MHVFVKSTGTVHGSKETNLLVVTLAVTETLYVAIW